MQKWWENNGNIEYWLIAKEELKTKDGNIYENNSSPESGWNYMDDILSK